MRARFSLLLILLLLALLPVGCAELDREVEPDITEVQDPTSALLGALLQDSDFDAALTWISHDTYQAAFPSAEGGMVEKASLTRAGKLDGAAYFVILYEGLERFETDAPRATPQSTAEKKSRLEPFSIRLGRYGDESRADCEAREDGSVQECQVVVLYPRLRHVLSILISPGTLERERLEGLVDDWLRITDERIGALPALKSP